MPGRTPDPEIIWPTYNWLPLTTEVTVRVVPGCPDVPLSILPVNDADVAPAVLA